jgi:hypothetical protein
MRRLARVNRTQVFIVTLALVLIGLFAPRWYGAGVLYALVLVLFLIPLRLPLRSRRGASLIRFLIMVVLMVIATSKILE